MQIYQSRFLTRGEVWYENQPSQAPVDWIYYRQRKEPVAGSRWKIYHSRVIELTEPAALLSEELSKSTAYQIKRARERDKVACECVAAVSPALLGEFEKAYQAFAASKHLPPLDRSLLDMLAKEGFLELSLAKDTKGNPLAYHVYYHDCVRSCLIHSVSLYKLISDSSVRNALARANRYLFWSDILRHKERGLKVFDFGGWYTGASDQGLLDINRFKADFGGKVVQEYNCEQILSVKAWVVLTVASVLNRTKSIASKLRSLRAWRSPSPTSSIPPAALPNQAAESEGPALAEQPVSGRSL